MFSDEPYKVELIRDLPEGETISLYQHGGFVDLCRGPHVPTTAKIPAVKVLSTAGAYWRGDSDNTMLTRIYGTAFASKKELEEYLARQEMAKPGTIASLDGTWTSSASTMKPPVSPSSTPRACA